MIKTAPTLGRIAVMALFALSSFAACLYLWMAFGGSSPLKPRGYQLHIAFPEATQLASQSDVRIAGVNIGKVIKLDPSENRTDATLEIKREFAPLPVDSRAILRVKSLLGETYVELTPGNRKGKMVADGGTLDPGHVAPTVELDEILSTFDAKTRKAFQTWMQAGSQAVDGRGADINAIFGELPGVVDKLDQLTTVLDDQKAATSKAVAQTGEIFDALSQREGELRGLVSDSQQLFAITDARNEKLGAVLRELPRFERESTALLPKFTAFGKDALPAIKMLQNVATEADPAFSALEDSAPEFRGLFTQLQPVIDASEKGLPALNRILKNLPPVFGDFSPFLQNLNPIVDYVGENKREVTGFLGNMTAVTQGYDIGGQTLPQGKGFVHYLKASQTLNPESLTYYPRQIGTTRDNPYPAPGSLVEGLKSGASIFGDGPCPVGNPDIPTTADPAAFAPLIQPIIFRTADRNAVKAPSCKIQGNYAGHSTAFPQLRAEP
ncbi:MlaD family protein [Baekduia sp. Peel2402]|uniref:MlaD family protein n=1 Tax=Baekduia sp. Peel2402 TaxID=3458296 RepID=UPI00403E7D39